MRVPCCTQLLALTALAAPALGLAPSPSMGLAPLQEPEIDLPDIELPEVGPPPLKASDGKLAAPGRVPSDASPLAQGLWKEMLKATRVKDGNAQPIRSFSMGFDVRFRERGEAGFPTKDVRAVFDFLDLGPGYVRGTYDQSGRTMMRGPAGDWSVTSAGAVPLRGREDETSRAELDRLAAICRNFVALTRPAEIRLVELRALELQPINSDVTQPLDRRTLEFDRGRFLRLPNDSLLQPAHQLRWLEVASPDFRLYAPPEESAAKGGAEPVYRALLGMDEQGQVRFAQFSQDKDGTLLVSTALFVNIKQRTELSGYSLPLELEVHSVLHDGGMWRFEQSPSFMLWGVGKYNQINPVFPEGHFQPPPSDGDQPGKGD